MVSQEMQENIGRLQMLEQNIQMFSSQRQNFHMQLEEIENAIKELQKTKNTPYKIIGNLMVASDAKELLEELTSRKETITLRVQSLEKQEKKLKEKAEELQKTIMNALQQEKGSSSWLLSRLLLTFLCSLSKILLCQRMSGQR